MAKLDPEEAALELIQSCLISTQNANVSAAPHDKEGRWKVRLILQDKISGETCKLPCTPEKLAQALTLVTHNTFYTDYVDHAPGTGDGKTIVCMCKSHAMAGEVMQKFKLMGFEINAVGWDLHKQYEKPIDLAARAKMGYAAKEAADADMPTSRIR